MWQPEGLICGVDEAGRGPLAGPVVAAAVILDPQRPIDGLNDSKKLTAARRETLAVEIRDNARFDDAALKALAATYEAQARASK